ncbi:hypothetical protein [Methylopila sp. M107]|uniref:hypothetical protein n=1 Tax=Methylopila sp. M107 TaxID=1101190 RepID=UPI00036EBDE8|nr:hypothetical protein [Methylopila sp. M107]
MSFSFSRLRMAALTAASVAALAVSGVAVQAAPAAVDLVFYAPHFEKLENGSVISYKFVRKSDDPKLEPSFEDVVKIKVGPTGAESSVTVDLFTGNRAVNLPNMSKSGNPVIVALLEQDVKDMGKALGGSPFYFRNRLRQAISADTPAEPIQFQYGGKTVDGWKVSIKPFLDDGSNRGKLREFAERTYEFTFSDAVPGGLYALKTVTPKAGGAGTLLSEELTVAESPSAAEPAK